MFSHMGFGVKVGAINERMEFKSKFSGTVLYRSPYNKFSICSNDSCSTTGEYTEAGDGSEKYLKVMLRLDIEKKDKPCFESIGCLFPRYYRGIVLYSGRINTDIEGCHIRQMKLIDYNIKPSRNLLSQSIGFIDVPIVMDEIGSHAIPEKIVNILKNSNIKC